MEGNQRTSDKAVQVLSEIFLEQSPVGELMVDISTTFHLEMLKEILEEWNINQFFRVVYKLNGNWIMERNYSMIKVW